jgi:hypothetical protein
MEVIGQHRGPDALLMGKEPQRDVLMGIRVSGPVRNFRYAVF